MGDGYRKRPRTERTAGSPRDEEEQATTFQGGGWGGRGV